MRNVIRWFVVAVAVVHGLIHLLGVAKGFDWAEVSELEEPISTTGGALWLVAAVFVVATGVSLGVRWHRWWSLGAAAVVISQIVIVRTWTDAWAGTIANVILSAAVMYGLASEGPFGARARYRRLVRTVVAGPPSAAPVTEDDLATLPPPVAEYVRRSGAVGQAHVANFRAQIRGRIRSAADSPWMTFRGEQVNTFGPEPARLFFIDATMSGLPVDVFHSFVGPDARMRVELCSLITMVDVGGPEMNRSETVTLLNDLCLFAPAALLDAPIDWDPIDERHVRATFTNGAETVQAELVFDDDGDLIDFVSDDRFRSIDNGRRFVAQRWSTPISGHREFGPRRALRVGSGRWHAPAPEGPFDYLEIEVDDIAYNVTTAVADTRAPQPSNTTSGSQGQAELARPRSASWPTVGRWP